MSIILGSNEIKNGDIQIPANPGPPGEWPLKRREKRGEERREAGLPGLFWKMADWKMATRRVSCRCGYQLSFSLIHYDYWPVIYLKSSVKEPNKFHIYESEKITRKASDAAEYIELFGSFTRDRHARRI